MPLPSALLSERSVEPEKLMESGPAPHDGIWPVSPFCCMIGAHACKVMTFALVARLAGQ
jgi:hypothetical protein